MGVQTAKQRDPLLSADEEKSIARSLSPFPWSGSRETSEADVVFFFPRQKQAGAFIRRVCYAFEKLLLLEK